MAEVRHRGRIALLAVAILFVFIGIIVRLCLLHLAPEEWVSRSIDENRTRELNPVGSRGRIFDRNGKILAFDHSTYNLTVDPRYAAQEGSAENILRLVPKLFGVPESMVAEKLSWTNRQYALLLRDIPAHVLKCFEPRAYGIRYCPPATDGAEKAEKIYLAGVQIEEAPERYYPKNSLMAHVVGFSNKQGVGSAGVEQRMNQYLRGKKGLRVSKKDGRSREIYQTRTVDIAAEDGANIVLTIDEQLQYKVEQVVENMCTEFKAKAGWAIVQHVRTGEILAMTSFPTYDLNRYGKAPAEWRRNRAISTNYEPGSTMKAAVIAAALDHGIVKETDLIDCENGYWVYGGKALRDSHGEGVISVADVIKFSSNIGTAKIALMMGDQLLYDSIKSFHYGSRLGVGLPGEEAGIFYHPKNWSKISATRIGMGHEISVPAIQVLSMMSTIAYNGVQMKPYVVKRIVAPDGSVIEEFEPEKLGSPIRPATARRMQKLLHRVTEEGGTGTKARIDGYNVAGKTGTAQKLKPEGGYYQKNFTSSFAGFLPVENPEIAIVVVADDPGVYTDSGRKIKYYGGTVCGPAFKEIGEFAVRYLRIPADGGRVYVARPDQ